MTSLRSYILESKFIPSSMARALFNALPLVEATNINKAFLLKTAGSPEALATAKQSVNSAWTADEMDGIVRNPNIRQKVLNILYLMEIRQPGFVNHEILKGIHDLAIANSLEQRFLSKVNSDTLPEDLAEILSNANKAAVQAAKVYPDLTDDEEKVWNRVKLYHEFPDGFKWIYAVDENGRIAPCMPSNITHKTMNHCGNSPRAGSDDQYWELRGPDGRAYLTVILNPAGEIQESKSWGNQVNKYRKQILPYVKWFLMDRKVTGVGGPHDRYSGGYSAHTNFGVKDFIGDDNEFVDYVLENKPALLGTTEKRTLFWKNALEEGIITVDDLKHLYAEGCTLGDLAEKIPSLDEYTKSAKYRVWDPDENGRVYDISLFGMNSFEVVCAACDGCPFSKEELVALIEDGTLSLPEFANYDIKLLTPDIQKVFVEARPRNLDTLMEIASQVATFAVAEDAVLGLVTGDSENWRDFFEYLSSANPPSKVSGLAHRTFSDKAMMQKLDEHMHEHCYFDTIDYMINTISRYDDIDIQPWMTMVCRRWLSQCDSYDADDFIGSLGRLDDSRLRALVSHVDKSDISTFLQTISSQFNLLSSGIKLAVRCGWTEEVDEIVAGDDVKPEVTIAYSVGTGRGIENCARRVVDILKKGNEADRTEWYSNAALCDRCAMATALLKFPDILESVDWSHDGKMTSALANIFDYARCFDNARWEDNSITDRDVETFTAHVLDRGVNLFGDAAKDVPDILSRKWMATDRYGGNCLLNAVIIFADKYGIDAGKYSAQATAICDGATAASVGDKPSLSYSHPIWDGIGTWIVFPMEIWQDRSARYGTAFIGGYIVEGGITSALPPETTWPALCDIIEGLDTGLKEATLRLIVHNRRRTNFASLMKELTDRLVDGRLHLSVDQMSFLMQNQLVPAKIIREIIDKGGDTEFMRIDTPEGIYGLYKGLHKMLKLNSLPALVTSAFRTTVDWLYGHLGVSKDRYGDARWEADTEEYAFYMAILIEKLQSRNDKYMPAKAFLALTQETELIDKLRGFQEANRKAADGAKPVWGCSAERYAKSMLGSLTSQHAISVAESTVAEKAPKPKAPRARKPKVAPSVA